MTTLDRGLGRLEATTLVVGGIIGVSIFLVPADVAREVGSPGLLLVTWVLSGLLAVCGALCFAELAAAILGPVGASVTALAVLCSAMGTLNAQLLSYPRIFFAQSRDGLFFPALARIHPVHRTPGPAILLVGGLAVAYSLAGTYQQILAAVGFVIQLLLRAWRWRPSSCCVSGSRTCRVHTESGDTR